MGHAISKAHIGDKRKASALTGRLHMGSLLVGLATNLPPAPGSNLQAHLANLKATPPPTALASVHDARDYVKRQAGKYFQSH